MQLPIPFHWDEIQFVFAAAHYDVRLHQPHPPGYFFFVLQGKLLAALTGDPYRAFQLLSSLYYCVALALFHRLARRLELPRPGETTFFFALSPLVFFHSLTGMSYMAETAWTLAVVLLGLRHLRGSGSFLYLSAALGIVGGVRQSGMVLLLPLYGYFWWKGRWPDRLAGPVTLSLFFSLAFVLMALLSGGLSGYRQALASQVSTIVVPFSILGEPERLFVNLLAALFLFGMGGPFFLSGLVGTGPRMGRQKKQVLAFWFFPPLLFLLLFHMRNPGYLLIVYPAYALWMGRRAPRPMLSRLYLSGWATLHAALFAFLPLPFTHAALRLQNQRMQSYVLQVEQAFPEACIVTLDYLHYGYRHAQYLFPERTIVQVRPLSLYDGAVVCHEERNLPCPPIQTLARLCDEWITLQDPASPPWTPKGFPFRWEKHERGGIMFYSFTGA